MNSSQVGAPAGLSPSENRRNRLSRLPRKSSGNGRLIHERNLLQKSAEPADTNPPETFRKKKIKPTMVEKYIAIVLMGIFYAAYLGKKFVQRRQGITTNQIGKGTKPRKVLLIENIMGWATFAVIPVEIFSIIIFPKMTLLPALRECPALQWTGLGTTAIGIAFFIVAMLTMADSWRAGIPDKDRTELVQNGIYRISRNPAFVGFDLMYIGLLLAFPNILHLLFALFPVIMLDLQIRQEEEFCREAFGREYEEYRKRVRRYL